MFSFKTSVFGQSPTPTAPASPPPNVEAHSSHRQLMTASPAPDIPSNQASRSRGTENVPPQNGVYSSSYSSVVSSNAGKQQRPYQNGRAPLSPEAENMRLEYRQMEAKLQERDKLLLIANSERDSAKKELENVRRELASSKQELEQKDTLLGLRTDELKDLQAFFPCDDRISAAEVTSLVDGLNAQIHQTAATIAEVVAAAVCRATIAEIWFNLTSSQRLRAAACDIVGEPILHLIHKLQPIDTSTGANPTLDYTGLVQCALQACLVNSCMRVLQAWGLHESPVIDGSLDQIYQSILEVDNRAIARRWKTITQSNIRKISSHHDLQAVTDSFVHQTVTFLSYLYLPAQFVPDTLFIDRVTAVAKDALTLKKAITEEFTSSRLLPVTRQSGEVFDLNSMDTTCVVKDRTVVNARVLVTTDIGLVMVGGGAPILLAKPKVLLDCDA